MSSQVVMMNLSDNYIHLYIQKTSYLPTSNNLASLIVGTYGCEKISHKNNKALPVVVVVVDVVVVVVAGCCCYCCCCCCCCCCCRC